MKIFLSCIFAAAKSRQSCPTLCDPIDGSPQGSPFPGILQARTLEWVAISFSNAWKWKVKVKSLSCVRLLATPGTAAHQAPTSMGFSRQESWNGVPLPCIFSVLQTGSFLNLYLQMIYRKSLNLDLSDIFMFRIRLWIFGRSITEVMVCTSYCILLTFSH